MKKFLKNLCKTSIGILAVLAGTVIVFASSYAYSYSVTITPVNQVMSGSEIVNGAHFKVTLDFEGVATAANHYNVGYAYAEKILDAYPDYEESVSVYLRWLCAAMATAGTGLGFSDMIENIQDSIDNVGSDYPFYAAEIQGMADAFDAHGDSDDDAALWRFGIFPENELSIEEIWLFNMLENGGAQDGQGDGACSAMAVYGNRSAENGDVILGRNVDFFEGITGFSGHIGKQTRIWAVTHFKNQGGNTKDWWNFLPLGMIGTNTFINEDGLFAGGLANKTDTDYSQIEDSVFMDCRYVAENYSTYSSELFSYLENRDHPIGYNVFMADTSLGIPLVIEHDANPPLYPGEEEKRDDFVFRMNTSSLQDLRTDDYSIYNWEDQLGGEAVLSSVNSMLHVSMRTNHLENPENPARLDSFRTEILDYFSSDDYKMDEHEVMEMMSYGDPDGDDPGDIYRVGDSGWSVVGSQTLFSIVVIPETGEIWYHVKPYNSRVEKPTMPSYRYLDLY